MAGERTNLAKRAAVMNCLARCDESNAPIVTLVEFLEKLTELGWDQADVRDVQTAVLRLLNSSRKSAISDAYTYNTIGQRPAQGGA